MAAVRDIQVQQLFIVSPHLPQMLSLLEHMYHELGLVEEFNINPIVLKRWLLCVQENYRNNPFHNFRHCFCVSQMMYGMIHLCRLWERMAVEDLGVLLTAAVCHDLDHPGYNNTFLQLKMVLIKCCDISNEVRPMEVSEPWVDCLLEEYFNQVSGTRPDELDVWFNCKIIIYPSITHTFPQVFTQIDEVMVQPLKNAKDRYEEMKSLEEAQKEVKMSGFK
ncbi:high affinity cGMP-specific 3',5'-cyclic phosphodiesterase 9A-like [Aplysia californica]|uniref:High affinity cGMP-specific 3',5'-cyclic phosphodiesterase 9A-like n=1 Tax=Aplysia californica TaxID=6500 RepID=A0ABM1VSA0_APLCA|nr:high affinity cGMP-specific 3',5'-cyclic phosphodiesterase 9A-like [Aplysia californica]